MVYTSFIIRFLTLQSITIVYVLWTVYLICNWEILLDYYYTTMFTSDGTLELLALTGSLGVNVYGWINGDFGGGRTARSLIKCLNENNVPLIAFNVTGAELHTHHNRWINNIGFLGNPRNDYLIDLFAINAANTKKVLLSKCNKVVYQHYRIGYWHWETSHLPPEDAKLGSFYHEIWVPSTYIADAIRATTTFPKEVRVQVLPYGYESYPDIEVTYNQGKSREKLPDLLPVNIKYLTDFRKNTKLKLKTLFQRQALVFLMIFDFNSDIRRKNIDDAITAFKTAFPKNAAVAGSSKDKKNSPGHTDASGSSSVVFDRSNVGLVIKTINSQHQDEDLKHLLWLMESDADRIINIDGVMSDEGLDYLRSACDCFLSLHRSEGLGLNIMEAILAARPVIATAFSGSEQFFRPLYAELAPELRIPATVVNIEHKFGPYVSDMVWGQPDIGAAVVAMREVQQRRNHYMSVAFQARRDAIEKLSPKNTGRRMMERLRLVHACLCVLRSLYPSYSPGTTGCAETARIATSGRTVRREEGEAPLTAEYCVGHVLGRLTNHTEAIS